MPEPTFLTSLFVGTIPNFIHDGIKNAWSKITQKTWEDIYLESFQKAFADLEPHLKKYAEDGRIILNKAALVKIQHQSLALDPNSYSYSQLTEAEIIGQFARAFEENNVFVIPGHKLSSEDFNQLARNLIASAKVKFKQSILDHESTFRQAIFAEVEGNNQKLEEISDFLKSEYQINIDFLVAINDDVKYFRQRLADLENSAFNPALQKTISISTNTDKQRRLVDLREQWLEGKNQSAVRTETVELKNDSFVWNLLDPSLRADYLRFEARTSLGRDGKTEIASGLARAANQVFPDAAKDARLKAHILLHEDKIEEGLAELEGYHDVETLNLKVGLLFENGQITEASQLLDTFSVQPNAETYRLRALRYILEDNKNFEQARRNIDTAFSLKPRWSGVRFTKAVLDYFSGLSPIAVVLRVYPTPLGDFLYKEDDESRARVQQAAQEFKKLSEEIDGFEERKMYEVWYLASLAHDADHRVKAVTYCRNLLASDPLHPALIWVKTLEIDDINVDINLATLKAALLQGESDFYRVVAVAERLLATARASEALELIRANKSLFDKAHMNELWDFWCLSLQAELGDTGGVLIELSQRPKTFMMRQARIAVLRLIAANRKDWHPLTVFLDDSYQKTQSIEFLIDAIDLHNRQRNWVYVADHADIYVEKVGTAKVVHLSAVALYNAGQFNRAIELLEKYVNFFPKGQLPEHLIQLKIACYQDSGNIKMAVVESQRLVGTTPSNSNLLTLAHLYLLSLDLEGVANIALRLENSGDLTSEQLIKLISTGRHKDEALTVRLWRRLVSEKALPDDYVPAVFGLGIDLGLDDETQELMNRMTKLAQVGSPLVQMIPAPEVVTMIKQGREKNMSVADLYERGTAPIHGVAEALNTPLLHFFHTNLQYNEQQPDPAKQSVLFARHGTRVEVASVSPDSSLYLDVSALLLANHLNILDYVERGFKSIHIPLNTNLSLLKMRERLLASQPKRLEAISKVREVIREGKIRVAKSNSSNSSVTSINLIESLGNDWVTLYEKAKQEGGYLLDYLPLSTLDGPIAELPQGAESHLINLKALIESLPLSKVNKEQVLSALGYLVDGTLLYTQPRVGRPLYMSGNIVEMLAQVNVLREVCDRYQVFIDESTDKELEFTQFQDDRRQSTLEWLDQLLLRLRRGVQTGSYQFLPQFRDEAPRSKNHSLWGSELMSIAALIENPLPENSVLWADDRMITNWQSVHGKPLVGVNEILKSLKDSQQISEDVYYQKLMQLRRGNVRFIPIKCDELLYHLRQSEVQQEEVVETDELKTLRRYVAAWLTRGHMLQRPSRFHPQPDQNGELIFALRLNRAVDEAVSEIWREEQHNKVCGAYTNWLMDSLYVDLTELRRALGLETRLQNDDQLAAIDIYSRFNQGFGMLPRVQRRYFSWLKGGPYVEKLIRYPSLIDDVANALKSTYLTKWQIPADTQGLAKALTLNFHHNLPEMLQNAIERDPAFMNQVGFEFSPIVKVGDLSFDVDEFWIATEQAVHGTPARILATPLDNPDKPFEVTFEKTLEFNLSFTLEATKTFIDFGDFSPLLRSLEERAAALNSRRSWMDAPTEVTDAAIAEINGMGDGIERIKKSRAWSESSPYHYYQRIYGKRLEGETVYLGDLKPPPAQRMLWHYRFPDFADETFTNALAASAEQLIREEGLQETLLRLSAFPTSLPKIVLESIEKLSKLERRQLFLRLVKKPYSPVSKLHTLYLLQRFQYEASGYRILSKFIVKDLLGERGKEAFESFNVVLHWVSEQYLLWENASTWLSVKRLALMWGHAHRIFSILVPKNLATKELTKFFVNNSRLTTEVFEHSSYKVDRVFPQNLEYVNFVMCGLGCAWGEVPPVQVKTDLQEFMSPEKNEELFYSFQDINLGLNALESFMTNEIRLHFIKSVVGESDSGLPTSAIIENLVLERLNRTDEPMNLWAWMDVLMGNYKPYEAARQALKDRILTTDFVALVATNLVGGLSSIKTVCKVAVHLDTEVTSYLGEQLLRLAQHFAVQYPYGEGTDVDMIMSRIIECILLLNKNENMSDEHSFQVMNQQFVSFIEAWRSLSGKLREIIQRFCEELPPAQAKHFWSLLVYLRANP
jgi:tetratricopeptide (TPR) repeat protein